MKRTIWEAYIYHVASGRELIFPFSTEAMAKKFIKELQQHLNTVIL